MPGRKLTNNVERRYVLHCSTVQGLRNPSPLLVVQVGELNRNNRAGEIIGLEAHAMNARQLTERIKD